MGLVKKLNLKWVVAVLLLAVSFSTAIIAIIIGPLFGALRSEQAARAANR